MKIWGKGYTYTTEFEFDYADYYKWTDHVKGWTQFDEIVEETRYEFIVESLRFAKKHLGIIGNIEDSFLVSISGLRGMIKGEYRYMSKKIVFHGIPTLDTIFHEAVHFWQHEQLGDEAMIVDRFRSYKEYWNDPLEIEAREKAHHMEILYSNETRSENDVFESYNGRNLFLMDYLKKSYS